VRLDHLLSKEHHEKGGGIGPYPGREGSCAVVAATGCATTILLRRARLPAHYWVLRQHLGAVVGWLVVWVVVAPSWWWGVVFGNWIVVASIRWMRCPGGWRVCLCNFDINFGFCVVSVLGRMVDALASRADEGRGRLRYASGSCQPSMDPRMSEWGNPARVMSCHPLVNI
jgi:hypothetical protein